jgi:MYXO-CTERM domain-containing protein
VADGVHGDPDAFDPDPGARSDIGATGGPDADPALWDDSDGDGVAAMWDCDPARSDVYPGAPEPADGIDHDCDGASIGRGDEPRSAAAPRSVRGTVAGCGCTAAGEASGAPTWLVLVAGWLAARRRRSR